MKRITLNIDLDDNEMFEKQVEDAIRAEVRTIVRNNITTVVSEEAKNEILRIFNNNSYGCRKKLENIVKGVCYDSISAALQDININLVVRQGIRDRIQEKIDYFSDVVTERCEETLNTIVTKKCEEKLKSILNQ